MTNPMHEAMKRHIERDGDDAPDPIPATLRTAADLVERALIRDGAMTCNRCGREAALYQPTSEGFIGWCEDCD